MLEALDQGPYCCRLNPSIKLTCSSSAACNYCLCDKRDPKLFVAATAVAEKCVSHVSMKTSKLSLYPMSLLI